MPTEAVSTLAVTGVVLALWALSSALWPSPSSRRRRPGRSDATPASC